MHFKLPNGLVNDDYLPVDEKHLSRCGMRRLLANAGINLKDSAKGDTMKRRGRNQTQLTSGSRQHVDNRSRFEPERRDARPERHRMPAADADQRRHQQPFRSWGGHRRYNDGTRCSSTWLPGRTLKLDLMLMLYVSLRHGSAKTHRMLYFGNLYLRFSNY